METDRDEEDGQRVGTDRGWETDRGGGDGQWWGEMDSGGGDGQGWGDGHGGEMDRGGGDEEMDMSREIDTGRGDVVGKARWTGLGKNRSGANGEDRTQI